MSKKNIQSVLIDSRKYDEEEAILWIKEHGYIPNRSAPNYSTTNFWRFRQYEPSSQFIYRTKKITPGIEFVLAYEKKSQTKRRNQKKRKTKRKVIKE